MKKNFLKVRTLGLVTGLSAVVFQDDWGTLIVRGTPTRNSVSTDQASVIIAVAIIILFIIIEIRVFLL